MAKRVTLSYQIAFDGAHLLPHHLGKCRNLHGHTWRCRFYITGDVTPSTGMLLDFAYFKDACKVTTQNLDHQNLNLFLDNPTAENISILLVKELKAYFRDIHPTIPIQYFGVELQEGDGGTCDYSEEVNE